MAKSIFERFISRMESARQLSEEKRQAVYQQVIDAEFKTEEQKELYKIQAQRAIAEAKKAIQNNDLTGKRNAMMKLKTAYGFYRYTCSMHDAFRTLHAQMQMQAITQEFADVVNNLSRIQVKADTVDFTSLTKKALTQFPALDMAGVDQMVDALVRGSIVATDADRADDAFLEALISGEASLDTPFPSKTLEQYDAGVKEVAAESGKTVPASSDIMKLLEQMSEGLKDD